MDEHQSDSKWKRMDELVRQFGELNRRMAVTVREIEEIRLRLHDLSDSEALDEIKRKLKLLSDHEAVGRHVERKTDKGQEWPLVL